MKEEIKKLLEDLEAYLSDEYSPECDCSDCIFVARIKKALENKEGK